MIYFVLPKRHIMSKDRTKKDFQNWQLIIWVLPIITLPLMAGDLNFDIPEMALRALLALLGGAIGFVLFWITKGRSRQVQLGTLGITAVVLLGWLLFFANRSNSARENLLTCEICGYKTLNRLGEECNVCLGALNDIYRLEEGYSSMDELIVEEQLMFFAFEEEEGVTFSTPKSYDDGENTYLKDDNWKPRVTKEAVKDYWQELEEFRDSIETESFGNQ